MGSTTPNRDYRYPQSTDAPSIPSDIQNLASDVDADVQAVADQIDGATVTPLFAYKTANETRASTTTLANDSDVTVSGLAASGIYQYEMALFYDGGAGGSETDFKYKLNVSPDAVYMVFGDVYRNAAGGTNTNANDAEAASTAGSNGVGVIFMAVEKGMIFMDSSPGTATLQWAQGTSGGTNTKLYKGSYLKLRKVG